MLSGWKLKTKGTDIQISPFKRKAIEGPRDASEENESESDVCRCRQLGCKISHSHQQKAKEVPWAWVGSQPKQTWHMHSKVAGRDVVSQRQ
jgi:hypothetical protein